MSKWSINLNSETKLSDPIGYAKNQLAVDVLILKIGIS